jgi:hypothetical protein
LHVVRDAFDLTPDHAPPFRAELHADQVNWLAGAAATSGIAALLNQPQCGARLVDVVAILLRISRKV